MSNNGICDKENDDDNENQIKIISIIVVQPLGINILSCL